MCFYPLKLVVRRHKLSYHLSARDTQICLSFETSEAHSAVSRLDYCPANTSDWMAANFIELNYCKTDLLLATLSLS